MQMHNDVSHDMKNWTGFFYTKDTIYGIWNSYNELQRVTKYNNRVFCYDMHKIGIRLDIDLVLFRPTIFFTFFKCMK